MGTDLLLTIIAAVILVVGFIGTFLLVLPGPPLAWFGLLAAYFSDLNDIKLWVLIVTAIFAMLVSVLDNLFPIIMTKKAGASKMATTGSTVGLIVGFFIGPLGVILGPFAGALVFELIHSNGDFNTSLKSAWGAFLGFLMGTGLKMATVLAFIWIYIVSFIN